MNSAPGKRRRRLKRVIIRDCALSLLFAPTSSSSSPSFALALIPRRERERMKCGAPGWRGTGLRHATRCASGNFVARRRFNPRRCPPLAEPARPSPAARPLLGCSERLARPAQQERPRCRMTSAPPQVAGLETSEKFYLGAAAAAAPAGSCTRTGRAGRAR